MANATNTKAVMTENLRDMGLDDEMIEKCLRLVEEKRHNSSPTYRGGGFLANLC